MARLNPNEDNFEMSDSNSENSRDVTSDESSEDNNDPSDPSWTKSKSKFTSKGKGKSRGKAKQKGKRKAKRKGNSKSRSNSNQNQGPSTSQNNNLSGDEWVGLAEASGASLVEARQVFGGSDEPDQLKRPLFDMHGNKPEFCKPKRPKYEFNCPEKLSKNVPCPYRGIFTDLMKHRIECHLGFKGIPNGDVVKFFRAPKNLWTVGEQIENCERHKEFFNLTPQARKNKWSYIVSIQNNCFLQDDGYTDVELVKICLDFLCILPLTEDLTDDEMAQYAKLVLIPQMLEHLLMVKYKMSEEKAKEVFRNYKAPEEEDLQIAQAPRVGEMIEEDDNFDENTGEVFESDVGALVDASLTIDMSDYERPKCRIPANKKKNKKVIPEHLRACHRSKCKKIFNEMSALIRHKRNKHPQEEGYSEFSHWCELCDELLTSRHEWEKHQKHVRHLKRQMKEKKAEKAFQNHRAPEEEDLQIAQDEDDIPDNIDNNTGEVFEPVVGALGSDPNYALDGQVPSTSHEAARERNLNLLNSVDASLIDLSDYERPKCRIPADRKKNKKVIPEHLRACHRSECKKIFNESSALIRHKRNKHPQEEGYSEFSHWCELCDELLTSRHEWEKHQKKMKHKENSQKEKKKQEEEKDKN